MLHEKILWQGRVAVKICGV